jgi:uncharacterized membrane protein YidH (DUF202 family)
MDQEITASSNSNLQVELAKVRTSLALDRTLLAWIRTSLTFITFGFALAKFMAELQREGHFHVFGPEKLDSPKALGLVLMMLGFAGLLGGALDYWRIVKRLDNTHIAVSPLSPSFIVAIVLSAITLFLMVTLALQTTP